MLGLWLYLVILVFSSLNDSGPGSDFSKENARTHIVDEYGITLPREKASILNLL